MGDIGRGLCGDDVGRVNVGDRISDGPALRGLRRPGDDHRVEVDGDRREGDVNVVIPNAGLNAGHLIPEAGDVQRDLYARQPRKSEVADIVGHDRPVLPDHVDSRLYDRDAMRVDDNTCHRTVRRRRLCGEPWRYRSDQTTEKTRDSPLHNS